MLVTVFPFLQSRLLGSPFSSSFGSYLFIAHNLSGFMSLGHATAISRFVGVSHLWIVDDSDLFHQTSPTHQTRLSILALLTITFLTTFSTLVRTDPNTFFTFIILVSISTAAFVSYFQSAVFAVASIFGPKAIQAVMTGQAAVAVVVNLVQLASVTNSIRSVNPAPALRLVALMPIGTAFVSGRTAEETSSFVCLAFATCLLGVSYVSHRWLVRTAEYKSLIAPLEMRVLEVPQVEERQALLTSSRLSASESGLGWTGGVESATERIIRVAKANVVFEVAIAYVFIVTLVSPSIESTLTFRLMTC